jgi:hypothetical protein
MGKNTLRIQLPYFLAELPPLAVMLEMLNLDFQHGLSRGRKNTRLNILEFAVDERAGSCSMPTTGKVARKFIAIDVTTGAKANFEATLELFDQNDSHMRACDCKRQVDSVFGITRQSSCFMKVFFENVGVNKLAIHFTVRSRKNATA